MKKLFTYFIAAVLLVSLFGQAAEAGEWTFHPQLHDSFPDFNGNGTLTVWGTIDGEIVGDALFGGYVVECHEYTGTLPDEYNDNMMLFEWDFWCHNRDWYKDGVPWHDPNMNRWRLPPLSDWMDNFLPSGGIILPAIGDPYAVFTNVYIMMDLQGWLANPRPLQGSYDIVSGACPNLPGYLIGTTPFVFDANAPSSGYPFSTTPLTGTLYRHGEITFAPSPAVPTVSEWGLIILAVLLLTFGAIVIVRRRRKINLA